MAKALKKIGILTVADLLYYFPFRYEDFSRQTPIDKLEAGRSANVVGQIELIKNKRSWKKKMFVTEALINDGTESLRVIWFNQPYLTQNLKVGDKVSLSGKVDEEFGSPVMFSPIYEKASQTSRYGKVMAAKLIHTQGLVPIYHLTSQVTQKQLRFLIKQATTVVEDLNDWLPYEIKRDLKLLNLAQAINKIHFSKTRIDLQKAKERLAFDELLLLQLQAELIRRQMKASHAQPIKFFEQETKKLVASLPFKLTDAQRQAAWEIIGDLGKDHPMARLLEGDVGSGKTIVAVLAMFNAVLNDKQTALMVPTEILARQHFNSISRLLSDFNIRVGLVTRSQLQISNFSSYARSGHGYARSLAERDEARQFSNPKQILNSNDIVEHSDIIIGTHALIQENVKFKNLALAIIDEQHRFGVEQRAVLIKQSGDDTSPHFLSMTATPIPRSLALALYGDLDLSIISQMPKGRKKIITNIVPEEKRQAAYEFIRAQIKAGRQVFVICPLIDFSDKLGVKSVEEEHKKLDKEVFPDLKIGKLHGRMRAEKKEKIMRKFLENEIKILVSTSVVEVGVDVPNATIMMIEGAERFGLAQIHQFRGRVGRSEHQSYCFLFTNAESENALKRLEALTKLDNGFELAKVDLKMRGPGEVYGLEQKGFPELKIATLFDYKLMKLAREQAVKLVNVDASLDRWPALKQKLGEWERKVHLE